MGTVVMGTVVMGATTTTALQWAEVGLVVAAVVMAKNAMWISLGRAGSWGAFIRGHKMTSKLL